MTDQPLPGIFELTPLNDRFRADPHVLLDDLRARCPAHKDPVSGSVLFTRYADVRATVNNLELWRDPLKAEEGALINRALTQDVDPNLPRTSTTSILMLDDPDHARVRQPLAQALYARVAKYRTQVEQIVDAALDALEGEARFDLMDRFCVPIPIDVIASILGVDHSRLGEFREWSEGVIQSLNPFRDEAGTKVMEAASFALNDYFTAACAIGGHTPHILRDALSWHINLEENGQMLKK